MMGVIGEEKTEGTNQSRMANGERRMTNEASRSRKPSPSEGSFIDGPSKYNTYGQKNIELPCAGWGSEGRSGGGEE